MKYFHAPWGLPPSHPLPQVSNPQQLSTSLEDKVTCCLWPLAIQILSLIAYTAANAQQEPHVLWSLTYFIDLQVAQYYLESKFYGIFYNLAIFNYGSLFLGSIGSLVPIIFIVSYNVISSNLLFMPDSHFLSYPFSFNIKSFNTYEFPMFAICNTMMSAMILFIYYYIITTKLYYISKNTLKIL